jgi:hypothetical protein
MKGCAKNDEFLRLLENLKNVPKTSNIQSRVEIFFNGLFCGSLKIIFLSSLQTMGKKL